MNKEEGKDKTESCEATISLKQIHFFHWCFESYKTSVSQDKTVFE